MLSDKNEESIISVVSKLNENKESKTHSRHFDQDQCSKAGLKIASLEADQALQDLVLSIHHCYVHYFNGTGVSKIIENQKGVNVLFS